MARRVLSRLGRMTFVAEGEILTPDIGKYRVVAELARGGMGNVYLALAQGPGGFHKLVAVKELKPEFCVDETYVTMFLEEARLAARLTHPNIVQTNEVGSEGNRHFMIMEYLDGRTLYRISRHLSRYDGFPIGGHLRIISEALIGLHYAHELRDFDGASFGIVHRDVSPLNVFVTFEGQTKILDFGIAKSADSALETRTGILKGRIAYMAPEQACGGKVDRRADVYSAGVMIWEAAAGRRLWPKMTDVEILSHLLRDGPPSLRAVCPSAAPELDAICAKAMARQLEERYPTASALVEDLEKHLARRDDVLSMRDIGALIGRSFDGERRKMNAVIEESIVRARESPQSGRMVRSGWASGTQALGTLRAQRDDLGSLPSLHANTPASDPAVRLEGSRVGGEPTAARRAPEARGRTARSPIPWVLGTIAACVASTAVALGVTHRANPPPSIQLLAPRAAANAEAAPVPARPVEPAESRLVDVSVRVSPQTAQITIDGAAVRGNPYHGRTDRDGRVHRIVAQADGYETKAEDVSFSANVMIDITLDRHLPLVRAGQGRGPAPAAAAPARVSRGSPGGADGARVALEPSEPAAALPPPSPADPVAAPSAAQATSPATPAKEADPPRGRAPLRPIVTSNPYGTP